LTEDFIKETIVPKTMMTYKQLLLFGLLGLAAVGIETCSAHSMRVHTVTMKDAACAVTSVDDKGKVSVSCKGVSDSDTDTDLALMVVSHHLTTLTCTLHQKHDDAACTVPKV
jgi:hypothetical protein